MANPLISISIACLVASFASAHFFGGDRKSIGGSFGQIYGNLTNEQRQELRAIFRNSTDDTKAVVKGRLDEFAKKLSPELQASITRSRNRVNESINNITQQARSLSTEAQALIKGIVDLINNNSITCTQERRQIYALIASANRSVLSEIARSDIQMPSLFGCCHHGGGFRGGFGGSNGFGFGFNRPNNFNRFGSNNGFGFNRPNNFDGFRGNNGFGFNRQNEFQRSF